ncbi:gasdermin-B isoform X2 [Bubalus bubalis]|uniref:gasdermin-B isoform X2 n=1 Tax=Bubalus bubalis TaxID=89462 RepID=UPI001E1B8292|nr:gasdermin-B isoform X2 [Bubalus bubalis]
MPTVFESISRAVVKEIDASGKTIAVRSLSDADRFHRFYLVKKRRRFFGYQYDKTNLTLKDILEREVPFDMVVPEFQGDRPDSGIKPASAALPEDSLPLSHLGNPHIKGQGDNFEILDIVDSKGSLAVKFHPQITFKIAFHIFQEKNIKLEKSEIPQEFLDSLKNKKLKKELPPSFQSIQAKREDLYIVTETLKTKRTETLKYETQFDVQILLKMFGFQREHEIFVSWTKPDPFQKVSEVQCSGELQMNSPANSLISSLFNAAGVLIEARAETIWDVLDALMELSEYRQFVAEVLDKGELRPVKYEVESILEENWGEGPLDVSCDPEAWTLCALYVVVSILLQLAQAVSTSDSFNISPI